MTTLRERLRERLEKAQKTGGVYRPGVKGLRSSQTQEENPTLYVIHDPEVEVDEGTRVIIPRWMRRGGYRSRDRFVVVRPVTSRYLKRNGRR